MSKHRLPTLEELEEWCADRYTRPGWLEAMREARNNWVEQGEMERAYRISTCIRSYTDHSYTGAGNRA